MSLYFFSISKWLRLFLCWKISRINNKLISPVETYSSRLRLESSCNNLLTAPAYNRPVVGSIVKWLKSNGPSIVLLASKPLKPYRRPSLDGNCATTWGFSFGWGVNGTLSADNSVMMAAIKTIISHMNSDIVTNLREYRDVSRGGGGTRGETGKGFGPRSLIAYG